MRRRAALLIGDARMAFPVSKALARAGWRVHAGVSKFSNYLEWSRHVSATFRHSPLEPGDDAALPLVLDWLDAHPEIEVVQPVSEAGLRFLTRNRAAVGSRAKLAMAGEDAVRTASDKAAMFALCERLEAPLAPYRRVESHDALIDAAGEIGFPLIAKPSKVDAPLFGRKAVIARNAVQLQTLVPRWPDEHPELLVQRYVRGPRHSVIFSAARGRLLGAVEVKAARTHEEDGTGYTTYGVTVAPTPAVREAVERMVEALAYSTTGCAQFIVDPLTGETTFMELNPRVSLARIAECAGLPHSVWGVETALGEAVEGFADPWATKRGVEYVWTKGDLNLVADLVRRGELGLGAALPRLARIAADAARCHHAIFDPLDPAPAVGVYANRLIAPLRRRRRETG